MPPRPSTTRFVAFSLVDHAPFMSGTSAAKLLDYVAEGEAVGFGHHPRTEVLDCGGEAEDVLRGAMSLTVARARFTTVFRAEPDGDLPALPLPANVDPARPGLAASVPRGGL